MLLCDYYSIQLQKPIRCEKRCYSDVRSKAYTSQTNLQHGTTTKSAEQEDYKVKTDMLRSIGKQSWGIGGVSQEEEKLGCVGKDFQKRKVLSLE